MNPIYCSTGAFITRQNNRDYSLIPSQAALLGWKEFELMLCSDWYPKLDAMMDFLEESGLGFPAVHAEKNITSLLSGSSGEQAEGERLLRENCRVAKRFGSFIVLHLWHGAHPASTVERLLTDGIRRVREASGETGVEILIENTPSASGSVLHYLERLLKDYPDQRFTVDVRHTTFQGEFETLLSSPHIWKNVRHVHISDYAGLPHDIASLGRFCPPGEGNVRFDEWFAFLRALPFDGTFTLESNSAGPHGIEDVSLLKSCLRFIHQSMEQA